MKAVRILFNTILPLAILVAGFFGMKTLIDSRPAPRKEVRQSPGPLVKVITARKQDAPVHVRGTGTVRPHREVAVTPQVSGRITSIAPAFIAGGFFSAGEVFFEIEKVDYELALESAIAARARAELDLARQESNARVARAEWERLNREEREEPNPLVLYEPQLKQARAALASADTAIRKAELDMERTRVFAPFNCRVRAEQADLGQYVRTGVSVAAVAGSDFAEVVVPLPLDDVSFLDIPRQSDGKKGSTGSVILETEGGRHVWAGRVDRSLGEVDPLGRMTRVVVVVNDPYFLASERPPGTPDLEVGLFVSVVLDGGTLDDVFAMPRRAIREGDTVWTVEEGDRLGIRTVHVLRREEGTVFVDKGLAAGDRVVVTSLEGAAPAMKVRPIEEVGGK